MSRLPLFVRLFQQARSISTPAGDFEREDVLALISKSSVVACRGPLVAARGDHGTALLEAREVDGCPIVEVDWLPAGRAERVHFWMNAHSVAHIGERLRALPRVRVEAILGLKAAS